MLSYGVLIIAPMFFALIVLISGHKIRDIFSIVFVVILSAVSITELLFP
jgi:hypothetical protein